jgi:6-phosphogluconate dehydrogenase (decarboxylating)
MAEKSTTQQILDQVSSLTISLATHISGQVASDVMTKAMYGILVTGQDGKPPLPEVVRRHEEWIVQHDSERAEVKKEHREDVLINTADTKKDRSEAVSFRRQIWLMIAAEVIGFILVGVEVALHMK